MIGSNNAFIYTASLCECSSWRKSLTGVLETTDTRREKHAHTRKFVLLHCQYDHVLLQEIKLFIEKETPFLFLCVRHVCSSSSLWRQVFPVVPLGVAQGKLSLPFQSTLLVTWPQTVMKEQCFYEAHSVFGSSAETASSHGPLQGSFSKDTSML